MPVLALRHTILLWAVYAGAEMEDPICCKVGAENGVEVVFGLVSFESLNLGVKLGLDNGV